MNRIGQQLVYFVNEPETRRNISTLLKFFGFLLAIIFAFSGIFHLIMGTMEEQEHSWLTGFYWTLTVMTTLGFGDITFHSDIGRLFSVLVLLTGVILLLIVLPFTFIRYFYAPWLEAQMRFRAPRQAPDDTEGHVIICYYDDLAPALIAQLQLENIPYYVIESDPSAAAHMADDGVSVIFGNADNRETYESIRASKARLIVANNNDTINTNIVLTIRSVAPDVPIMATADNTDSIDILELSGADFVLPLKQRLGEGLIKRINAGHSESHVISRFRDLQVSEFSVRKTPLAGLTVEQTQLRQNLGLNIVSIWERGNMLPVTPNTRLSGNSVVVVMGTEAQMQALDEMLIIYDPNYNPVLVIGGGKVGTAASLALKENGVPVHLVERDAKLHEVLLGAADKVFIGDAADGTFLQNAGLRSAPAVLLTTNDDAMNIYLTVYCRRLNPDLRIVSRITHQRNTEAIHRAGADFVLSCSSLATEFALGRLEGRELTLLGDGVEVFALPVPPMLVGLTLSESGIGARTGLIVIGLETNGDVHINPIGSTRLDEGTELIMFGNVLQHRAFTQAYS